MTLIKVSQRVEFYKTSYWNFPVVSQLCDHPLSLFLFSDRNHVFSYSFWEGVSEAFVGWSEVYERYINCDWWEHLFSVFCL